MKINHLFISFLLLLSFGQINSYCQTSDIPGSTSRQDLMVSSFNDPAQGTTDKIQQKSQLIKLQKTNRRLSNQIEQLKSERQLIVSKNDSLMNEYDALISKQSSFLISYLVISICLIILQILLFSYIISRRLNSLRVLQKDLAIEHDMQLRDQEALVRSIRGSLERLESD
jgi:hypothetical protein